jgi:uncharacterized protein involved in exopolysaccharide biosynthesis
MEGGLSMNDTQIIPAGNGGGREQRMQPYVEKKQPMTARDLVAVVYRRKRLIIYSFLWMFAAVLLFAVFYISHHYDAEMEIIVNNHRADPYVSAGQAKTQLQVSQLSDTTQEDALNSEVELLKSKALLQKVVVDAGLDKITSWTDHLPWATKDPQKRIAKKAEKLYSDLTIEYIKKSFMIKVTYGTSNPETGQRVLECLAREYLTRHLLAHRPPPTTGFFAQQTNRTAQNYADADQKLARYDQKSGEPNPVLARDTAVAKLADFQASLRTAQVSAAQTQDQIDDIERQLTKLPPRITTVQSNQDAYSSLSVARSQLLTLEVKRTQLLTQFQPTYPLVQQVEAQIAEAQDAIAKIEQAPTKLQATDNDPTYLLLQSNLATAKAALAGYQAQAAAYQGQVNKYRAESVQLDQTALGQAPLVSAQKAVSDNYLLYVSKQEEALIDQALDEQRIMNVSIAEPPIVPMLPFFSPVLFTILGAICAGLLSIIFAFIADYYDPSVRTPGQVMDELSIPVLASIPKTVG